MKPATHTDPRLEIAETLFEAHSEIRYVLARPITSRLLSRAQHERLERLLSDIEGIQ